MYSYFDGAAGRCAASTLLLPQSHLPHLQDLQELQAVEDRLLKERDEVRNPTVALSRQPCAELRVAFLTLVPLLSVLLVGWGAETMHACFWPL